MKRIIYVFCLYCVPLCAQQQNDPLKGVYNKSGETSEIFMSYSNRYFYNCIIDVNDALNEYEKPLVNQEKRRNIQADASATGDFDGDLKNDIVNVYDTNNIYDPLSKKGILLTVDFFNSDLTVRNTSKYVYEVPIYPYTRKRICTGNFDDDLKDEFAICFQKYNSNSIDSLGIAIFELDSNMNIVLINSLIVTDYDWNFDIAAGNLDENIQDEIVLIKNSSIAYENKCETTTDGMNCYPVAKIMNELYILKLDASTNKIVLSFKEEVLTDHRHSTDLFFGADPFSPYFYYLNGLRIVCGDMNGDYKDEIIVGTSFLCGKNTFYSNNTSFQRFWYEKNGTLHKEEVFNVSDEQVAQNYDWKNTDPRQFIALTLKSSQFDTLKGDEIIINDRHNIYVFSEEGLQRKIKPVYNLKIESLNTYGNDCFAVADINPKQNEEHYSKEIITLETNTSLEFDWVFSGSKDNYGRLLGDTYLGIYTFSDSPKLTYIKKIFELDPDFIYIFSGLNAGDFNFERGDVLFFGNPEVLTTEIHQPIVVLNSPPIHFDVLNDTIFDLNNAYNISGDPPFYAQYYTLTDTSETMSTKTGTSYGYSDEYKDYDIEAGSGFEETSTYFMEHEKSLFQSHDQSISVSGQLDVCKEDWILSSVAKYKYYRYPVYNRNLERISYFGILSPYSDLSYSWESGNSSNFLGYSFNHENGNILSYKSTANSNDFSRDISGFKSQNFATQITISDNTKGEFGFSFTDISKIEEKFTYQSRIGMNELIKSGYDVTVGADIGINLKIFQIGESFYGDISKGTSSYIGSNYSQSDLCTHTTEVYKTFRIKGKLGNLKTKYNNIARYKVTPYFYRSQCGAMVLDYKVELDPANKWWWTHHYLDSCDLAFILPWRYGTEHGEITLPSQKQKTNEIQFFPSIAAPGDTICIITRVHNYSLKPFNGTLEVDYYLGDPKSGIKIKDIKGVERSKVFVDLNYDSTSVDHDFEEILTFFWKVPETITCSPRIYAVIDPDNTVDEIHKNNNIGWNSLPIYKCTDCLYDEPVAIQQQTLNQFTLNVSFYPNPTTGKASIMFTLSSPEHLRMELFTLAGVKIGEIIDRLYSVGKHTVDFDGSDLNEGIYLLRTTANNSTSTMKISILK